ncbi:MAG: GNAT family N-acetyltransferase [Acidimicrobiales bacterium]|nr:GNAT family N-acetyltransferase [Acidimicrobiales bacterium]
MPPLRGTQVALRPWASDFGDALTLARAWNDPDVVRWTTVPEDRSVEAARRWISTEDQRRARGLAVDLAVTAPSEPDRIYGEVGFVVAEADRGWAEVGYWMFPEARREGHASEAVALITDWALRELSLTCLFARTNSANPASGGVARNAGYDLVGELEGGVEVWARNAADQS